MSIELCKQIHSGFGFRLIAAVNVSDTQSTTTTTTFSSQDSSQGGDIGGSQAAPALLSSQDFGVIVGCSSVALIAACAILSTFFIGNRDKISNTKNLVLIGLELIASLFLLIASNQFIVSIDSLLQNPLASIFFTVLTVALLVFFFYIIFIRGHEVLRCFLEIEDQESPKAQQNTLVFGFLTLSAVFYISCMFLIVVSTSASLRACIGFPLLLLVVLIPLYCLMTHLMKDTLKINQPPQIIQQPQQIEQKV